MKKVFSWKLWPKWLSHAAAFVIVVLSIGGITSKAHVEVTLEPGVPASAQGLPFMLTLHDFEIDRYPGTMMPRQYTSRVAVVRGDGLSSMEEISVNHPARIGAWGFYQADYMEKDGIMCSILECVRDPLYPGIRIALWVLMIAGALLAVKSIPGGRLKWLWGALAVVFVLLVWYTMDRVGVGSRMLPPALKSPWFVPHVVSYMFAYATLTVVTVVAVVLWIRSQRHEITPAQMTLCSRLVKIGWGFLTVGLCMGALWAKEAWGDWWSWDIKETWALITWLGYGAYFHLERRVKDPRVAFAWLIFDFLLLLMCWFGVNYLPSGDSMHVYNN